MMTRPCILYKISRWRLRIITVIHLLLAISLSGYSQSLAQVKTLYDEGRYEEAKPGLEKLVRQSPNNSNYNQWYGVCCYETQDYENAEKYLTVANKRKVMESYRYLAMLYTDLYRFNEAVGMWEEYITLQKKQKNDPLESERKLDQARNLNRMKERTEDVQVIDSMVVPKNEFLETYKLSEENGVLMMYSDFFKDSRPVSSTVYINQKGSGIYFARPSDNGVFTIYSQSKLLDAWGDVKPLLANQLYDNNYPFVMSDGVTMYFASKGNESIGGYDIFVTRYNTNTNTYLTPEQMGMPFNSPANDYMMVIDESKGLGWFVSDRNQPEDYVCVYLFIYDPSRKRIETNTDPAELRRRAALGSIKESWKDDADYARLIQLASAGLPQNEMKKEHDFEFFINDKTIYYTLNEIKSPEAKDLYMEVLKLNQQIKNLKNRLDEIRNTYSNTQPSVRQQLKVTILQAENQLYTLMEKTMEQEKKARNAENLQLGIK